MSVTGVSEGAAHPNATLLSQWRVAAEPTVNALAGKASDVTKSYVDPTGQSVATLLVEGNRGAALHALLAKPPVPHLGGTILTAAVFGRCALIPVLVRAGADVRETDGSGASALHRAAEGDHADVVTTLLEMGCPVDARDKLQRTPLHAAVAAGAVRSVLLLLKAGADINSIDDLGRSAGELTDALRGNGKGVDDETLAAIYDLFKDELEAAGKAAIENGEDGDAIVDEVEAENSAAAPSLSAGSPAGAGEGAVSTARSPLLAGHESLRATAALTGDASSPIVGIDDIDTLIAILLAKFRASIEQGLVAAYEDIYRVLDSAGEGKCDAGDFASGGLEMGIEIMPALLQPILDRISGRPGAQHITLEEFVAFCKMTPEQLSHILESHSAEEGTEAAGVHSSVAAFADRVKERLRVGVENEEQPSYEAYFAQFDGKGAKWFDAAALRDNCELLGLSGTAEEFQELVAYAFGECHVGVAPAAMHVNIDEFLDWIDGVLPTVG